MIFAFAGTIATWITEDWQLVERVLDFKALHRSEHTGIAGGRNLFLTMKDMGTAKKMSRSVSHLLH